MLTTKMTFKRTKTIAYFVWVILLGFHLPSYGQTTPSVSILMYHHVSEDTPRVTSVTPEEFESHLQYLQENNFNVISLLQAVESIEENLPLPDKAVVLTFDDAYLNLYESAAPLLDEYEMPWTLFVSTEVILENPSSFMSWEQLRELHSRGVTIANHSTDHSHLPRRQSGESWREWESRMRNNITAAQSELEEKVGIQNKLFAYPFGEYNNRLREILAELGFHSLGQHSGAYGPYSDPQAIPRFPASGNYADLESLSVKMLALNLPTTDINFSDSLLTHSQRQPNLSVSIKLEDITPARLQCFIGGAAVEPNWVSEHRFQIQAANAIPVGRSRYNCTAPSNSKSGRYYWFSQQWIRPDRNGNWPD